MLYLHHHHLECAFQALKVRREGGIRSYRICYFFMFFPKSLLQVSSSPASTSKRAQNRDDGVCTSGNESREAMPSLSFISFLVSLSSRKMVDLKEEREEFIPLRVQMTSWSEEERNDESKNHHHLILYALDLLQEDDHDHCDHWFTMFISVWCFLLSLFLSREELLLHDKREHLHVFSLPSKPFLLLILLNLSPLLPFYIAWKFVVLDEA